MRVRIQEVVASLVAAKQICVHTAEFYLFLTGLDGMFTLKEESCSESFIGQHVFACCCFFLKVKRD